MRFLKELNDDSHIELVRARIEYAKKREDLLLEENFKLSCEVDSLNYLLSISLFGKGLLTNEDLSLISKERIEKLKVDVKENNHELAEIRKLVLDSNLELANLMEKKEREEKSVLDIEMAKSTFGQQSKRAMRR